MRQIADIRIPLAAVFAFAGASFSQVRAEGNAWESAYTRYRFAVDAASGSGNCMQLSDVALYDESGAAIPSSAFKLSFDDNLHGLKGVSAISPEEEGPENAVDGDTGTKWLDWRGGRYASKEQRSAVYLEFRFAAPTKLSGYAWFTANDSPDRSPSAWRFLASNDGASWTELDAVKGFRGSDEFKSLAFRRRFADIPLYRFKVDATKFPDVAKLVEEKFRQPIEAMAPNVVSLLDGAGAKWTGGEITIVPTDEEGAAWTSAGDDKIWLCNDFVRESPDEVVGALLHEFGHLVQDYRPREGRAKPYSSGPGWLCEGIVDWVRWFNMEGAAGVKCATEDAKKNPKLDAGYGITASFLDYIARTCDRDFVAKLNKTCRDGRYGEGVWKDLTGNTIAELEEEWKRSLKGLKRRSSKIVSSADAKDILDWADPFIGSAGTGHTTPAAAYPFGMVQPGPDTGLGGWERCSSYQYGDSRIERFSQTHLSGTGCSDFSDVAFMPFTGDVAAAHAAKFRYGFDKSTEKASPGYYAVELNSGVKVEATCTEHVALYRFTFRDAAARLLYDPTWGHGRVAAATISPMEGRRVSGHVSDRRGWPDRDYYFAWEVSAEPTSASVVERDKRSDLPKTVYSFENLGNGERGTGNGGVLYLKVALSRSSAEGARRNIDAEVPGWDFDGVLAANRAKWRSIFSRVEAKGAVEQLKTLYTSIYHLCFQPNRLSDVGEKPIYSTFSCWDTYRAAGPLYTILMPEYVPAFIDSMLWHFDQNGYLPVWTLWGRDNQCMVGVHSVPMIVDACLKGLGNGEPGTVDWERAWRDVKATLTENRGRGIARYELIEKYGYYPCDIINDESVSRLLEDCYDQYCAYRLADALGKADEAKFFRDRSLNWTNVFDSATGFMRAKDSKGAWRTPFDPYRVHGRVHHNYTEGNAFHWNWHVMQDPELLVGMLGGRDAALKRLTALFEEDASKLSEAPPDVTGLIGQYCHGNEPSHHVIYFFSLLGRRDLAAKYIKEVMDTQYGVEPDGLCGNDDCGQMSAWCIFASLGFYPFNPCGGEYVLGEAQLPSVSIDVGGGKTFRVVSDAPGVASRAVELNGRKLEGVQINHTDIMKGGTLRFVGGDFLIDILKPDKILVDGVEDTAGRVKLSPCRCPRREVSVYLSGEAPVSKIELVWNASIPKDALVYGGDWERTYGDSGWFRAEGSCGPHDGWKPWYFLVNDGKRTDGYGLMVQPNAFGSWKVSQDRLLLSLDVRAGSRPLELKGRTLKACTLVSRRGEENETPFAAAREFCRKMCPNPRLPKEPIYGYNDWYCAYGNNTATNFLADAEFIVSLVKGEKVRPYVVVDDGWQRGKQGSAKTTADKRWAGVNEKWGIEMDEFARRVKAMDAKPGLWYRPFLPDDGKRLPIDPTDPALEKRIRADVARFVDWGFKLIKTDFITFDWCTAWGGGLSPIHHDLPEWSDKSRTTAEVVKELYTALREAAGDKMVIIGCNALDHFAAGLFEIQRTGDDTSGNDWGRTRLMGPNTVGMRAIHHGTFYVSDGDCFGLTHADAIPWRLNSQWLDLVSRSGTALFVSWKRQLTTPEIRKALEESLRRAAKVQPVGEPLDWLQNIRPVRWRFGDEIRTYNWE